MGISTEKVRFLNTRLAEKQQVVFRTQGRARTTEGAYTLLNIRTGEKSYLTLAQMEEMSAEVKRTKVKED